MAYDILGLGCVAVDESFAVEQFPAEDSKVPVICRSVSIGGTTATALLAAAKLGASCAYAGTLGEDPASRLVLETFQQAGIDTSLIRHEESARPIRCTILICRANGSRTVFYDLERAAPAAAGWPPDDAIRAARLLLVDQFGREGIIPAARVAKAASIPIVADLEHLDQPGDYADYFELADHVILSRHAAARLAPGTSSAQVIDGQWSGRQQALIVTAGAEGLWYRTADDAQAQYLPAYAVAACDTTGCGDVFRGAYSAALLGGDPIVACLRFAAAAAALRAAATAPEDRLPTLAVVKQLIATGQRMP